MEICDPKKNTWSDAESMTVTRSHHTATLLTNGSVLVAGGDGYPDDEEYEDTMELATAVLYHPDSQTWLKVAPLRTARQLYTATLLANGKVLLSGGVGEFGGLSDGEMYDPASNKWAASGLLKAPRWSHTATMLANGRVLVDCGVVASDQAPTAELYDPLTDRW